MKLSLMLAGMLFLAFVQPTLPVLTQSEKDGISYMREEEKLARDVYEKMYEKYNMMPFGNIRRSEQVHMDRMEALIVKYNLQDPVKTTKDEPGKFVNPVLQNLYNDLIKAGNKSYVAALEAGAKIEEIDIADLNKEIAGTTSSDVKETYQYLKWASENHINAFNQELKSEGVTYKPTVLSQKEFDEIIANDHRGKGMQGGKGMQNGKGGKGLGLGKGNGKEECKADGKACCQSSCGEQKGMGGK